MYIGLDLGTSGLKAVVINDAGELVASETAALTVSRPKPLWSEQSAESWWSACETVMAALANKIDLTQVKGIGLSGQMHGATLLDKQGGVLRPAILWNDGRCAEECSMLEEMVPNSREITGNIMMPGFTAPKLLWVQRHEPEIFAQVDKVLLPKDYLSFCLTGGFASDMSDAAGTMWLDVDKRSWSQPLLEATGLSEAHMPKLYEGCEITGYLKADLAQRWGMNEVPVVAGAGDNAAGAVGVGITKPGQAMLSLGTSGVYFAVSDGYLANAESAVHSFCHALPGTWHLMSVHLSAASCLDWVSRLTQQESVPAMLQKLEAAGDSGSEVIFLPYLSGERTPHNAPEAKGVFFGMTHETKDTDLIRAVLEGVGFAFADGFDALDSTGLKTDEVTLIGGGARSPLWRQMLANILNRPLTFREGGDVGPGLGAARLAQLGVNPEADLDTICPQPEVVAQHQPEPDAVAVYAKRLETFRKLYPAVSELF